MDIQKELHELEALLDVMLEFDGLHLKNVFPLHVEGTRRNKDEEMACEESFEGRPPHPLMPGRPLCGAFVNEEKPSTLWRVMIGTVQYAGYHQIQRPNSFLTANATPNTPRMPLFDAGRERGNFTPGYSPTRHQAREML